MRPFLAVAVATMLASAALTWIGPVSAASADESHEFVVSATQGWQFAGNVKGGKEALIKYVSGSWTVDYRNFGYVGIHGYSRDIDQKIYQGCKMEPGYPYGVMLGRYQTEDGHIYDFNPMDAEPSGIWQSTGLTSGSIFLRIHDDDRCLGDNRGSITMRVQEL